MKEIRQIIELYDQLKSENIPAALAVVVNVEQSSYRRIGARLLVAADGRYVGGISGGCLEGDALKRAKLAIHSGRPAVHTYDTTDGEDAVIGIGLGCEGRIDVLFSPVDYADENNELEMLRGCLSIRKPVVLVRLLDVFQADDWSAYNLVRPRLITDLTEFKAYSDSLSSNRLMERAAEILAGGRSKVDSLTDERDQPFRVLYETLHPRPRLILTGYNYDIPATLAAARLLDWETIVVAPIRKLTREITALADQCFDYAQVAQIDVDEATAIALMSHDYDWDRVMVQHFLPLKPTYFGMLGPRKRMIKMDESLPELDLAGYENLYAPVGLDIGAETPEEIAVSLIAEIVACFRNRSGGGLRKRSGSIHV